MEPFEYKLSGKQLKTLKDVVLPTVLILKSGMRAAAERNCRGLNFHGCPGRQCLCLGGSVQPLKVIS